MSDDLDNYNHVPFRRVRTTKLASIEALKAQVAMYSRQQVELVNRNTAALKRIGELEAENAKLREIAGSIGNGATCSPNCTLDFMESVADEVRLVTIKLRTRVGELEALLGECQRDYRR